MSDCEVLIIFHYDGNFEFDIIRPVYNGGKQKMRYLSTNITYGSLVAEAIEASNWDSSTKSVSIQYLHHNGRAFSLASIEDDNDVNRMIKASGQDTNGIYLYVSKSWNNGQCRGGEQYRFQRNDKHRCLLRKSRSVLINCNGKEVKDKTIVPELPTVDLQENNDMHFSTVRNITIPHDTLGQEIDVDNIEDGAEYGDENHFDENNFTGQIPVIVMGSDKSNIVGANPVNNAFPSSEHSGVNFIDNMVPEESNVDIGNNSAREMWVGREFPDRDTFRKTLAKFAIYGNFTLKHLKTNMYKVTACCKDQNCPWRIHASIVESGPQFKVRTYNHVHRCSKPMMGIAHKQASALLISEFIMDRVRQNVNLKPKEIMNDYQMEYGTTISYRKAHIAKEIALRAVRGSY
ncbi:Transposase, MuDR, plant [Cinnamomum micranthum f. kanehirae]|uniref:Transposase, MuDR, plant n=1 Tax=Cinnamomum micranthum f. kanehirae TaxID=337451 RepID=A0A443NYN6_9MAGN|nr:Transposase, MuDR, plant [Cinnamomum micranthum f. kanehirae]